MLSIINLFLILLLIGSMAYLFIKQQGVSKTTEKRFEEIKARMGTLVKELNYILAQKRKIDDRQGSSLNKLRMGVSEESM